MSDTVIRPLAIDDLADALRLSTTAGWNQLEDDWRLLLRLAPAGAFAALIDGSVVGTAIGIDYGGFGWIAMMLVDPAFRGRGIGRRLLEAAIDAVPRQRPIRLDATPLGRPLYQQYGFEDEAMLSRHVSDAAGRKLAPISDQALGAPQARPPERSGATGPRERRRGGSAGAKPPGSSSCGVRRLTTSDLEKVIGLDVETFGGARGPVLAQAFQAAPHYASLVDAGDGIIHYSFGRAGRLFDQIGPVAAGHEDIADALVNAALAAAGDRPVVVDAFDEQAGFAARLRRRGFVVQRPLVRMRRAAASAGPEQGVRAPGGRTHAAPLREFAIFGPEFA